ncbi:hypothetical protein I7101_001152 [Vibrio cholerae]|nr:hypothetical protein [Vibrio cholerae]
MLHLTSLKTHNARLRGWQRITLNSTTTTETTAAQWDWKRHALTVPLEAFVRYLLLLNVNEPICIKTTLFRHFYELVQNASFYSRRS